MYLVNSLVFDLHSYFQFMHFLLRKHKFVVLLGKITKNHSKDSSYHTACIYPLPCTPLSFPPAGPISSPIPYRSAIMTPCHKISLPPSPVNWNSQVQRQQYTHSVCVCLCVCVFVLCCVCVCTRAVCVVQCVCTCCVCVQTLLVYHYW